MNRRDLLIVGSTGALLGIGSYATGVGPFGGESDDEPECIQKEEWSNEITSGPTDPDPGSIADRHDCTTATRPEPTGEVCSTFIGGRVSAGVAPYPDPPSTFDRESLVPFVSTYEQAYTQNSYVRRYGDGLIGVGVNIQEEKTRVLDRDDGITAIRIHFTISSSNFDEEHGASAGDSAGGAVYGVDETGIVRAEADYHSGDVDEGNAETPDPVEDGTLLECFLIDTQT